MGLDHSPNAVKPKVAWLARVARLEDFFIWPMPHLDSPVLVTRSTAVSATPYDADAYEALSLLGQKMLSDSEYRRASD